MDETGVTREPERCVNKPNDLYEWYKRHTRISRDRWREDMVYDCILTLKINPNKTTVSLKF